MLRIEKYLPPNTLAPAVMRRAAALTLPYDQRCRSRLAVQLDDGREAALFLPRGTILRDGSVLVATDGTMVRVTAAVQPVLRVASPDRLALMRAAYHLGNRHTPVQVAADWLQLEYDPVLRDMLLQLGVQVEEAQAAFDPESGAYGGGHRHGHDDTFAEDHALAQQVFAHRHATSAEAKDHTHDHSHAHDHSECRDHSHSHSHATQGATTHNPDHPSVPVKVETPRDSARPETQCSHDHDHSHGHHRH